MAQRDVQPAGTLHTLCPDQQAQVEVEIGGVAVVIGGLLEVDPIRQDLAPDFCLQNTKSRLTPALAAPKDWQGTAKVDESERLTGQRNPSCLARRTASRRPSAPSLR